MNDDSIPVDELRELVEHYRARAEANKDKPLNVHGGIATGRERSAVDLEKLIEDHTDE